MSQSSFFSSSIKHGGIGDLTDKVNDYDLQSLYCESFTQKPEENIQQFCADLDEPFVIMEEEKDGFEQAGASALLLLFSQKSLESELNSSAKGELQEARQPSLNEIELPEKTALITECQLQEVDHAQGQFNKKRGNLNFMKDVTRETLKNLMHL